MAIALDTLEYARRLRESGFTEQQAEGQARALAAAMTDALATKEDLKDLEARIDARFAVTKADLKDLEARIDARLAVIKADLRELDTRMQAGFAAARADLEKLEARFDGKLADLERRVTVRLGGIMVAGIGVLATLVTLL